MDFKVQNIVGTADLGFPIRLEGLLYAHSVFCSYEPEVGDVPRGCVISVPILLTIDSLFFNCKLFPGLIYRLVNPRVVFLIFVSGKIVITGAKKETDLSVALTKLYPVLLEFKKVHTAGAFDTIAPASQGNGKVIRSSAEKRMEEV